MSDAPGAAGVLRGRRIRLMALPVVAAMAAVAALPFGGAFDGWSFQIAVAAAAVAAAGVSSLATAKRWLVGESVAALVGAYVVAGVVVVGGVPSPDAFGELARGAVNGWAELLSVAPPAESLGALRAVPFSAVFFGAALGCELARNTRRLALPALGPLATLALAILFSPEARALALPAGCILAAGFLVLMWLRGDALAVGGVAARRGWFRAVAAAAALALVVAGSLLIGPKLPGADANDRFALHEYRRNPFDPFDTPSPLVAFKGNLAQSRVSDVMFEVEGTVEVTRFAVATLAVFDGRVWAVADGSQGRQSEDFHPVSSKMPASPQPAPAGEVELTLTIRALGQAGSGRSRDPWLPRAGWVTSVESERTDPDFRLNLHTGTLALNGGLEPDERFTVRSRPPLAGEELEASADLRFGNEARYWHLPSEFPRINDLSGAIVEGSQEGFGRVLRLRDRLREGYYAEDESAPPGHNYSRILSFLGEEPLRGYDEQYAAAAAVLARAAEIPARVVVGYRIDPSRWRDGTAKVRSGDITAWLEVLLQDQGWITVDVTPDKDREYEEQDLGVVQEPVAIPNPPPPPPPAQSPVTTLPQEVVDEGDLDEEDEEEEVAEGALVGVARVVAVAGAAASVPMVLGGLFLAVVALLKARRLRRRRRGPPTDQVLGAWGELRDRFAEAGLRGGPADTPSESIEAIRESASSNGIEIDVERLRSMAEAVDYAAYAPADPEQPLADRSWGAEKAAVVELKQKLSLRKRVVMLADPRTLTRRG